MIPIICIEGATASGKSELAVRLARELSSEIISADSRQVYKYLDIGTAKPNKETLLEIKHHLIDIINPDEKYNTGLFIKDSEQIIQALHDKGKIPIVCGGSMLYIEALLNGISYIPDIPVSAKEQTNEYMNMNSLADCYKFVCQIDADFANQISPSDKQRISRVLDVWFAFKQPITKFWNEFKPKSICKPVRILIDRDRNELYKRINQRMFDMVHKQGLLKEIYDVLQRGYKKDDFGLKAIGYKEFIHLFINNDLKMDNGQWTMDNDSSSHSCPHNPPSHSWRHNPPPHLWHHSLPPHLWGGQGGDQSLMESLDKAAQHTRNYAKRQMTWYRKKHYDLIINNEYVDLKLIINRINTFHNKNG